MKTKSLVLFFVLITLLISSASARQSPIDFKQEGYKPLFNGKDLGGWVVPEGDNGHWQVLDGIIDYDALSEAKGNKSLYTKAEYSNYRLHIEWRFKKHAGLFRMPVILPNGEYARDESGEVIYFMMPNADSGILMRGKSQVQVWCWGVGSGELWGTRRNRDLPPEERARAVPKFHADNPVGEWNAFDIILVDDRVTVYLNGILVIDNGLMPGLPEKGPIGLQHHGGINNKETGEMKGASSLIQFRNIWIKEL